MAKKHGEEPEELTDEELKIQAENNALGKLEDDTGDGDDITKDTGAAGLGTIIPHEVQKQTERKEEGKEFTKTHGYIPVNLDSSPSMGMFYPVGARFKIRGATTPEIKNWSLLDEGDILNIEEHIAEILEACLKIEYPEQERIGRYSDIKEMDRYYFLFLIREHSMKAKNREKRLYQTSQCPDCGRKDKSEIDASRFSRFDIPKWIKKYYSEEDRCFHIVMKDHNVDLKIYIPSLGVDHAVKDYITKKEREKRVTQEGYYDLNFVTKYLPFLIPDTSFINDTKIKSLSEVFESWNEATLQTCVKVIEELNKDTVPKLEFRCEKAETKASEEDGLAFCYKTPVRFRDGYRSIFDFSGVLEELLSDPE